VRHYCGRWPIDAAPPEDALRAARRPPAPTLRGRALAALHARLSDTSAVRGTYDNDAMVLALQALQEGADG
jgi:hypothetical protein